MRSTPLAQAVQRTGESTRRSFDLDDPVTALRFRPEERKPEQVKRLMRHSSATIIVLRRRRPLEWHESRFLRVQLQTEFRKSLRQHFVHSPRIAFLFEGDHEVVSEAHQLGFADKLWFHVAFKPRVEHLMQVHVRQERRDDSTLRRARFGVAKLPLLHYARVEPLADQAQHDAVSYPPAQC